MSVANNRHMPRGSTVSDAIPEDFFENNACNSNSDPLCQKFLT